MTPEQRAILESKPVDPEGRAARQQLLEELMKAEGYDCQMCFTNDNGIGGYSMHTH